MAVMLYGGPDQIMGLASGVTATFGVMLMFWNKLVVFLGRIFRYRGRHSQETESQSKQETPGET